MGTGTDPFQGYMDDVRFYGCALDLSQIEQVRLSAVPELRLSIALVDAASVRITWATNFTGEVLEFATSLPAMDWRGITNAVTTVGDRRSVTMDTSEVHRVYRLRKP
jgi:hypothetical protein